MDNLLNSNLLFYNLLNEEDTESSRDKDENMEELNTCLITDMPLENNYITLECGHNFNYIPLHNEVVYQKMKKILDNSRLKIYEIKCPYCRNITNKLLPFYKYYDVKQLKGVNYPVHLTMDIQKCEYIDKKNIKCNNNACITKNGIFCNKHFKYTHREEELIDGIDEDFLKTYRKKTLKELKLELVKNKLKLSGKKEELINRIYIYNKTKNLELTN